MLSRVVGVVPPETSLFEMALMSEVFGQDRSDEGLPVYTFDLVAATPGPIGTGQGFTIDIADDLSVIERADLVMVAAGGTHRDRFGSEFLDPDRQDLLEPLYIALRAAHERGARVASLCSGAFFLGAAGLLDGRRCTTHWRHADALAARHPKAQLDRNVLYVDEDRIATSAGTAAGIDLALHVIRAEQGSAVANGIARRMIVPPHREGGQAQYISTPVPCAALDTLGPVLDWMAANLGRDLPVDDLARRAAMSPRTFARRFRAETGTSPARWLADQRVLAAQHMLERTDLPVDAIADRVGFGSAVVLRTHFVRLRAVTPNAYRHTFRRGGAQHDPNGLDPSNRLDPNNRATRPA